MATGNKQGKIVGYVNYRMKAILNDGRTMVGQMLAFDKHMNLVLADTEEFRVTKKKAARAAPGMSAAVQEVEEKRTLGLIILRGSNIVSLSVEGPPPADASARLGGGSGATIGSTLAAGGGVARPAGRGLAPGSLQGPAPGVGGPGFPGAPPAGFPPAGFPGRGGPPGAPPAGFPGAPPAGFPGAPPSGFPGAPPAGFGTPPGQGRGFPPPGFGR